MDFSNVAILTAAAWGLIACVLVILAWIFTGSNVDKITAGPRVIVCLICGPVVVILVSISEWGESVKLTPRAEPLDTVSFGGLLLIGLFLAIFEAGVFAGLDKIVTGFKNMGQNELTPIQREALDVGAQRLVDATFSPDNGGSHPHADDKVRNAARQLVEDAHAVAAQREAPAASVGDAWPKSTADYDR